MGIKTVSRPPYIPDLAPCVFWLFLKLRGCGYETIKEMKEAVTKVIDILTQEDFHWVFQKLLERYNKCITASGDYFEGDSSFMCVLSIKVPIQKKSGNLFNDPRIYLVINTKMVTCIKRMQTVNHFIFLLSQPEQSRTLLLYYIPNEGYAYCNGYRYKK